MRQYTALLVAIAVGVPALASSASGQDANRYPVDRVVATVGSQPILWSEVMEAFAAQRARGMPDPPDSASQMALARQLLQNLIDEELMVQRARELAIEVPEEDIRRQVDQQIAEIRGRFASEEQLRAALLEAGFASIEEYRRLSMEQARRGVLQRSLVQRIRQDKQLPAVAVTEEEVTRAVEQAQGTLGNRPATVTFRQVVIPPQPSPEAKAAARRKADSLLALIREGGDFEQLARRESMDSASAQLGGDLGWARRGAMVPTFEYWLYTLQPGQVSPVFETLYGYHILRVDRVQPAERKSRHILIRPEIDSVARARTRALADSVAELWRNGTPFDTLVAKFHDNIEERGPATWPRDSLPAAYQQAFAGQPEGSIVPPFPIGLESAPKYVVAHLESVVEAGEYSATDYRQIIREQLMQEKAFRKWLDGLRQRTYVAIRM